MIWILIGYIYLYIHRPFEVWPVLGAIRLERVYMIAAIVAALNHAGKRWPPSSLNLAYAGFVLALLASRLVSRRGDLSQVVLEDYLKILVFYAMMVSTVRDERGLRLLVAGFVAVNAFNMLHSLSEYFNGRYVYRMGIARMVGVNASLGNPNAFAGGVVVALPFVPPVWASYRSRWARLALLAYVALSVVCINLTGSRTGFLCLLLAGAVMIGRSRYRWRLAIPLIVLTPMLWSLLPPDLQNRFTTIIDPEVGPANAQVSAESRLDGFYMGVDLWRANPLLGIGPGAWKPATGSEIEAHNLYGQVLGEMGTVGALALLGIIAAYCANVVSLRGLVRRYPAPDDFLAHMVRALDLALLLLLVQGYAGHTLYRYTWVWFGGFLVVARQCALGRAWEAEHAPGPLSGGDAAGPGPAGPRQEGTSWT